MKRKPTPLIRYTIRPLVWRRVGEGHLYLAADFKIWKSTDRKFRFCDPTVRPPVRRLVECKTVGDAKRMAERIHRERLAEWLEPVEERGGS